MKLGRQSGLHLAKYETDWAAFHKGQSQQQSTQLFTAINTLDRAAKNGCQAVLVEASGTICTTEHVKQEQILRHWLFTNCDHAQVGPQFVPSESSNMRIWPCPEPYDIVLFLPGGSSTRGSIVATLTQLYWETN